MAGPLDPASMPSPTEAEGEREAHDRDRWLRADDRQERAMRQRAQHAASGGLPDDPTQSGMPVRNKRSFKINQ